jgi:hypothetical protein
MTGIPPEAGGAAEVVHLGCHRHRTFLNPLTLSGICQSLPIKSCNNNTLKNRLKNRQAGEPGRIQGKFAARRLFYPELSTEMVDSFSLAQVACSVQPTPGIAA